MNSRSEILGRLLKSYPVNLLRSDFDIKGRGQWEVIDTILVNENHEAIYNYCFEQFGHIKQHGYIFQANDIDLDNFELGNGYDIIFRGNEDGWRLFGLMKPIEYMYFNLNEQRYERMIFNCPIMIKVNGESLSVSLGIMEKNVNSYTADQALGLKKSLEEHTIIQNIEDSLRFRGARLNRLDITKGLKTIWQEEFIACLKVVFKKAKSTSSETMDEEFTLKEIYPEIYEDIMSKPIETQLFKFIKDGYVKKFKIEPMQGRLTFSTFTSTNDAIRHTIELILSKNN